MCFIGSGKGLDFSSASSGALFRSSLGCWSTVYAIFEELAVHKLDGLPLDRDWNWIVSSLANFCCCGGGE
ncbi:hypothetical protein CBR_g23325 [Chara braunii]|uniref:Uncharacterized protein n=1 Tax=Chara braunii TaxID=69332 RepID=A0A388L3W2_CHABU|nr:hypothetical protein CBR_g23325 [Chara braunii]|eukprot:GBG76994.1 hypothetical protein CBR_g23325 [Chara braunii]